MKVWAPVDSEVYRRPLKQDLKAARSIRHWKPASGVVEEKVKRAAVEVCRDRLTVPPVKLVFGTTDTGVTRSDRYLILIDVVDFLER